jgi:hypothetical protein
MLHIRSILFLCMLLFSATFASAQYDCGCDPSRTWQDDYEKANVVVLATCMGQSSNPIKGGMNIVFQVDSSWKRKIEPVATIHTEASNQCGFPFKTGEKYLVWGNKRHQTISTTACEHNLLASEVEPEIWQKLGPGYGAGRPELGRQMNLLLVAMGAGCVLFVGFIVLRKRIFGKRKPKN